MVVGDPQAPFDVPPDAKPNRLQPLVPPDLARDALATQRQGLEMLAAARADGLRTAEGLAALAMRLRDESLGLLQT